MKMPISELRSVVRDVVLSEGVKEAWAPFAELIEDPEFGGDMSSDEEVRPLLDAAITEAGVVGDPALVKQFREYVLSAARDYYYSEHAGNAPGPRSSHHNDSLKWTRLAKNVLRQLLGKEPRGRTERAELEQFLSGMAMPDFDARYTAADDIEGLSGLAGQKKSPQYSAEAKAMVAAVVKRYSVPMSLATNAVTAFLSIKSGVHVSYYEEELDNAALRLRAYARRSGR
jgi:hypothetical protein